MSDSLIINEFAQTNIWKASVHLVLQQCTFSLHSYLFFWNSKHHLNGISITLLLLPASHRVSRSVMHLPMPSVNQLAELHLEFNTRNSPKYNQRWLRWVLLRLMRATEAPLTASTAHGFKSTSRNQRIHWCVHLCEFGRRFHFSWWKMVKTKLHQIFKIVICLGLKKLTAFSAL